jgi:hypothetical protein
MATIMQYKDDEISVELMELLRKGINSNRVTEKLWQEIGREFRKVYSIEEYRTTTVIQHIKKCITGKYIYCFCFNN